MTTIQLHTSDQTLITSQKVKIAAGDINSVLLRVEFDEAWNDFTERKAVFKNDAVSSDTQDILLIGNECVVPHEVLSKDGTLEISVTGCTSDGQTKKTSTIAKLKVLESLKDAITTVAPTLDLYMQYLATVKGEISPVVEQIKNETSETLTAKIAEMTALIEEQRNWMQGTVLWENPDPTADIGDEGLTIPLDRTQYPRLHIEALFETINSEDEEEFWQACICVHSNGAYFLADPDGATSRTIRIFDDRIQIGKSSHLDSGSIPFRIIGYKY